MTQPGENVNQLLKMPESLTAAREKWVVIELKTLRLLFSVTAKDRAGENNLGSAHQAIPSRQGEFLSINDADVYHTELVWYYSQLRWRAVYEVRGESWQDFVNVLVWGGVGTCMDADLPFLLAKWATTLTPKSATKDDALESNHAPVAGNTLTHVHKCI
ncbi:unnamed protein product [Sphagnum compactum]